MFSTASARIMLSLLLLSIPLLFSTASADGVFKWKDRYGKTQYGDKPPKGVKAEPFTPPPITVIKNYGNQWRSSGAQYSAPHQEENKPRDTGGNYQSLSIIAPKADQAIRANDGDVTLMLDIKPKLKKGHSIVVFLDGKQVSNGTSRAVNLTGLDRGLHQVSAEIRDAYNASLIASPSISFTVLRTSILNKKKKKFPTYP